MCSLYWYTSDFLTVFSFLVDFNHAETDTLFLGAFVFAGEDHNFVAWKAESLFFRHFEDLVKQAWSHTLCRMEEMLAYERLTYSDMKVLCNRSHLW